MNTGQTITWVTIRAALLTLIASAAVAACSSGGRTTGSERRVVSVLVLEAVDGSLPGVVSHDTSRQIEILSDTTTLFSDLTYESRATVRITALGVQRVETVERAGRYMSTNTTVEMFFERAESMLLERHGDRLSGISAGRTFTYTVR